MKIKRLGWRILGISILLLTVAVVLAKVARPPKVSEVAGAYSGYGDQIEFLRLELETNGTGLLAVS